MVRCRRSAGRPRAPPSGLPVRAAGGADAGGLGEAAAGPAGGGVAAGWTWLLLLLAACDVACASGAAALAWRLDLGVSRLLLLLLFFCWVSADVPGRGSLRLKPGSPGGPAGARLSGDWLLWGFCGGHSSSLSSITRGMSSISLSHDAEL